MAMLTIGGVILPNPTSYKVSRSDLDSESTTRNEAGFLQRDRVRTGVYKIEATWQVKRAAYKTIVDALSGAKLTVVFFDPNSASTKTATMYAGDRSGTLVRHLSETKPTESLWELSCSLIEY